MQMLHSATHAESFEHPPLPQTPHLRLFDFATGSMQWKLGKDLINIQRQKNTRLVKLCEGTRRDGFRPVKKSQL